MKKVTMEVKEKLEYTREIEVMVPEEMTESDFEKLCLKMDNNDNLSDALYVLKKAGVVVGKYDEDYDSPEFGEVEVVEFDFEA